MAPRAHLHAAVPVRSFRAEDLVQLLSIQDRPCVSIYLPTHRRFPEWKQDPVRFRQLLTEAEKQLQAPGGARETNGILEPLRRLLDEPHWEYALDGFAALASPSFAAAYRLPLSVAEGVVVADTFHTKPLLQFVGANRRYFVLAISQNSVSLYEGSSFGAGTVELRSLPEDLQQALGVTEVDEYERGMAAHTSGRGGNVPGRPGGGLTFHGRGPGREETKEELLKFFRAIDRGLQAFLRRERAPLILASVRYYQPIYREANTYAHLVPEMLEGNYERANADQIHAEAWPIVRGAHEAQVRLWVERYRAGEARGLALDVLDDVAFAVVQGRVWAVLAAENANIWGRLDRATGEIRRQEGPPGADDSDLLDDVCEEAFQRGAEIFVVPPASLPTESPIAAVLRF